MSNNEPVWESKEDPGAQEAKNRGGNVNNADVSTTEPGLGARVGIFIVSTIVGLLVYLPFLLSILFQSLYSGLAVNPANWQRDLRGSSWIVGLGGAAVLIFSPLALLGASAPLEAGSGGFVGALVLLGVVFCVNLATLKYASMRPELCRVEGQEGSDRFVSGVSGTSRWLTLIWGDPGAEGASLTLTSAPVEDGRSLREPKEETKSENPLFRGDVEMQTKVALPRQASLFRLRVETKDNEDWETYRSRRVALCLTPCWLGTWRNWLALGIAALEALQLLSISATSSPALARAFRLQFPALLDAVNFVQRALWTFGTGGVENSTNSDPTEAAFVLGVTIVCLYSLLAGVFIALDLTVTSALAPVLFNFLAGGLYVSITSTLCFVIFHSTTPAFVAISFILMAYYSATGVFMSIYRSDEAALSRFEVRTIPLFLGGERVCKGLLAVLFAVLDPDSSTRGLVICLLLLLLSAGFAIFSPVSVQALNQVRATTTGMAAMIAFLGFVLDASSQPGERSTAVLMLSLAILALAGAIGSVTVCPARYILRQGRASLIRPTTSRIPVLRGDRVPPCFLCASCLLPRGITTTHELEAQE